MSHGDGGQGLLALTCQAGSLNVLLQYDCYDARLAQSVERKALNLVVVGSSPTVGAST